MSQLDWEDWLFLVVVALVAGLFIALTARAESLCHRWQPRAVAHEPDAGQYPAYPTRDECREHAVAAVIEACRGNYTAPDQVKACVLGLLPKFVCVPACGPAVDPDQAESTG